MGLRQKNGMNSKKRYENSVLRFFSVPIGPELLLKVVRELGVSRVRVAQPYEADLLGLRVSWVNRMVTGNRSTRV